MRGEDVLLVDGVGNAIVFRVMNAGTALLWIPTTALSYVEFVRTDEFEDGHRIYRQAGIAAAALRKLRRVAA